MKKFIILLCIFMSTIVWSVFAISDDIEKQEGILDDMEEQLNQLDETHKDFVDQQNKVIRNIRGLEEKVRLTEDEIKSLNVQIQENQVQVNLANLELDAAKQKLSETNDLLDSRIRVMYMNGTVGYFEVLLESKNFEDLLVRIDLLQRIIESDTDLILQMEVDQANVEEKKANLENEQTKLVTLQDEMTVKKSELKAQIAELEEKQIKLEEDIEAVAIQIDEINEDAEKVKAIIEDLKLQELYAGGKMIWPVDGYRTISSPFGNRIHPILGVYKMHTGIDIPCPTGTKIMAAQQGTVIWSNWLSSYGKAIMIDHGGGIVTLYAHNSSLIVKKGDKIVKGQVIALSGSTGNSTGPHLHFEVRENGEYVDPMIEWLQASEY